MIFNDFDLIYLIMQVLDDLLFYDVVELNVYFYCVGKMIFFDV